MMECRVRKPVPTFSTINKSNIDCKTYWEKVFSDGDSEWSPNKTPSKLPYEQPLKKSVEGRQDEKNVKICSEEPLRLYEALSTFKSSPARSSNEKDSQVKSGKLDRLWLRNDGSKYLTTEEPHESDGNGYRP
ncbi:MAG: hypothetical protein Q9191_005126 [Dirinaria sp. TL-2023a]